MIVKFHPLLQRIATCVALPRIHAESLQVSETDEFTAAIVADVKKLFA
jgi:hypothetical protein